jgi:hypothetical protein
VDLLSLDPADLFLLLLAAALGGAVDAVAGGGGLIVLPAILSAGLPPHLALGTNKLAGTLGTLSSSRAYVRRGLVHPGRWRATAAATFIGALAGTLAVSRVPADLLRRVIPLLVVASAIYVLLQRRRPPDAPGPPLEPHPAAGIPVGLGLGFYDGFLGPGVGAFWVSAAMAVFHLDLVRASGVARYMNFVSNAVSLATFAALGLVDWPVGLAVGGVLMAGAWVGAHTAIRFGATVIRPVFVVVVLVIAGKLAWESWVAPTP